MKPPVTTAGSAKALGAGGAQPTGPKSTRHAPKWGADMGAGSLQAGAATNLEQLKNLEPDVLLTLRIKQLKDVLGYMAVDFSVAVEKKDLVALIVRHRDASAPKTQL